MRQNEAEQSISRISEALEILSVPNDEFSATAPEYLGAGNLSGKRRPSNFGSLKKNL